jgi:hypothetical protein
MKPAVSEFRKYVRVFGRNSLQTASRFADVKAVGTGRKNCEAIWACCCAKIAAQSRMHRRAAILRKQNCDQPLAPYGLILFLNLLTMGSRPVSMSCPRGGFVFTPNL